MIMGWLEYCKGVLLGVTIGRAVDSGKGSGGREVGEWLFSFFTLMFV